MTNKSQVYCDTCGRDAPALDEAREQGWFMSVELSVAGIPMTLLCPDCVVRSKSVITSP